MTIRSYAFSISPRCSFCRFVALCALCPCRPDRLETSIAALRDCPLYTESRMLRYSITDSIRDASALADRRRALLEQARHCATAGLDYLQLRERDLSRRRTRRHRARHPRRTQRTSRPPHPSPHPLACRHRPRRPRRRSPPHRTRGRAHPSAGAQPLHRRRPP